MRVYEAWEKNDFGGPRPTWRRRTAALYPRGNGPSIFTVRRVTNRRARHIRRSAICGIF
jgi:hypothetical protein